ncbi:MAG: thiamine-phosphate synthase family protein, partial [Syntrophales bacterium]|nr:thiamine-phosphate synthase family protein [Syntrophales bacterium]
TLEWGTDAVMARPLGAAPDVIWDCGEIGKEPMIRVLGRSPGEVVDKVIGVVRIVRKWRGTP